MWEWFLGENGDFRFIFLPYKVGRKGASLFDFSRQDAESQSFEGRYAFYGTRIEKVKWIFKDFDSFAIMDGSGFISSILAVFSTSRLSSPLESPEASGGGEDFSFAIFSHRKHEKHRIQLVPLKIALYLIGILAYWHIDPLPNWHIATLFYQIIPKFLTFAN
jgi:hypothetical protein